MKNVRMKMSPPWVTYMNEVEQMFDGDPDITLVVSDSATDPYIILMTKNGNKAAALQTLFPSEKYFGNVTLKITIDCPAIPNKAFPTYQELFETAFEKNPAFAYVVVPEDHFVPFTYVVFKNCVIQFFNDNLNDPHGVVTTLYQEIAYDLFKESCPGGVSFCTDVERKIGKPLGEWP